MSEGVRPRVKSVYSFSVRSNPDKVAQRTLKDADNCRVADSVLQTDMYIGICLHPASGNIYQTFAYAARPNFAGVVHMEAFD